MKTVLLILISSGILTSCGMQAKRNEAYFCQYLPGEEAQITSLITTPNSDDNAVLEIQIRQREEQDESAWYFAKVKNCEVDSTFYASPFDSLGNLRMSVIPGIYDLKLIGSVATDVEVDSVRIDAGARVYLEVDPGVRAMFVTYSAPAKKRKAKRN